MGDLLREPAAASADEYKLVYDTARVLREVPPEPVLDIAPQTVVLQAAPVQAAAEIDFSKKLVLSVPHASGEAAHWMNLDQDALWAAFTGTHNCLDRGASELADGVALRLGAGIVKSTVSRLIVDPNRNPNGGGIIPATADNAVLIFNTALTPGEEAARLRVHQKFHAEIEDKLSKAHLTRGQAFLVDTHSFDRYAGESEPRQVDIGVVAGGNPQFAEKLLELLRERVRPRASYEAPSVSDLRLNARSNEPYSAEHPGIYVARHHASDRTFSAVIECCDDLLRTPQHVHTLSALIAEAIRGAALAVENSNNKDA